MTENIELQSFGISSTVDGDVEEYHEINQDAVHERTFANKYCVKHVNAFDFFTQQDVKTTPKESTKKKKTKKKGKSSNLMDIINSELASMTVPVSENVVTFIDSNKQYSSYLDKTLKVQKLFQKSRYVDSERGLSHKLPAIDLSPIFPRVLENAIVKNTDIPVQYMEPAMFNDLIANKIDSEEKQTTKFLDIAIQNIKFKHHHHFPLEKLLCIKLVENYNGYTTVQQLLKDILKDIKINRETRDNIKKEFLKISPNKKEEIRFDPTVRKYTEKLLQAKEKHVEILKREKQLIHNIVSLWSDIEMIRDKSGFTKTAYVLEATKDVLDENEFEKQWHEAFNKEFTDFMDKMEYDYVTKYMEYKKIKNELKSEGDTKKKITKPKLDFDEETLKEEAETLVNSFVVKEKIHLRLKQDNNILTGVKKTHKTASKIEYYFLIYVDDIFVCESEHFSCKNNNDFEIEFSEFFTVEILLNNNKLTIILLENEEEVSNLKISLSEINTDAHSDFVTKSFVYNNIIEPDSKCVGSGHNIKEIAAANKVRLKSSNIFKGNLYSACEVSIKMSWNDKLNENHNEAVKSSMEVGRQIKRLLHGIDRPSIDGMIDIISKVYGKDISKDEDIINTLMDICKMEVKNDDGFALEENTSEFVRIKLLHLRNIGGFGNIENKCVPIHGSQISTEQLNCLQKSNDKDFDIEYINDKYSEMDPIELQRFIGAKYVQKVNTNMLKNLNEFLMKKTHKDVVRDFKDLSLRGLFTNQSTLATLATISSSAKQQLLNECLNKEQEIQVTVIRAFNLLDRSSTILSEDEDDDRIAGFKVRPLRPFVRVSYHGVSTQTGTAIGCHPTWNQTLKIKTKLEPLSSLQIHIYDEYKANISERYSEEEHSSHSKTVHYRYYNKWLGTLNVPLYNVLTSGMLRGTFKIASPPLLFGYENSSQNKDGSQSLIPEVTQLMRKETTYICLLITSNLSHLGGSQLYNQPTPSDPEDYIIKHLNTFVTEYTNDFPLRNINLTFIDSSGQNKCVTQFLQPIPLPDYDFFPKRTGSAVSKSSAFSRSSSSKSSGRKELDVEKAEEKETYSVHDWRGEGQLLKLIDASLRYVSLIPAYEVTETHAVTLLGIELLKVIYGSPLDHTLLLASYFLYLGLKCWVVIGLGLPRGPSSYVLTKYDLTTRRLVTVTDQLYKKGFLNKNDGYMWYVYDATSGERHELRDVGCPLKTVDYVFDNENIWVNIQNSQDCESVSFDFSRSSDWQSVFDKTVFLMKQPIVSDVSLYSPPAEVDNLRQILETKLRAKIQKWRPHMKTIWNRYCSGLLREVLPAWEHWAFNPSAAKPGLTQRLKQLMVTYKMFGFPLNMPYINTKSVISTVKSTAAHMNDDPNAEFALAVEVFAYPNNVLSVWVFLGTITRI